MTKRSTSFFIYFLLLLCSMEAQVSLDNGYFPISQDTLRTVSIIPEIGQIPITDSGGDQIWDFSNISDEGELEELVYNDYMASDTSNIFPEANLIITGSDGSTFIKSTENTFEILGFEGLDPTGFGLALVSRFEPSIIERTAPLDFLDFDTYSSSSNVTFGADLLPAEIFNDLPFAPDSLRVLINLDLVDLVDAWGTVRLPNNASYETLRQKRVQLSDTRLEVKVPILDWVDITDQFGDFAGGGGFLGVDTLVSYTHWADGVKEPIATLTLDSNEESVLVFEYKAGDNETTSTTSASINNGFENIYAYPNPAINYAKFDCVNLSPDYYELKIYNILGLEAYKVRKYMSGNKMIQVDLTNFRKGTYLYSLSDTTGKVITTKRLVIIKP